VCVCVCVCVCVDAHDALFLAAGLWLGPAARGKSDPVIMASGCSMPFPCTAERRLVPRFDTLF